MSEKADADEFDDEDADESSVNEDDANLDHLIRDVEKQRRRAAKGQEPHWRRLERVMEEKRTAELLSDFEDYDIGDDEPEEMTQAKMAQAKPVRKGSRSH